MVEDEVLHAKSRGKAAGIKRGAVVLLIGFEYPGIGMKADGVLDALGEAKSRVVSASCAFGGNDIVYDYRSVKISANDEEGFERVYCVELVDDMAQTEEGIKIGATAEAVTAAYGEPTTSNAGGVIYTKGGVELRFLMKDGKVTSIQYMLEGVA
jgi:hypothetical protein